VRLTPPPPPRARRPTRAPAAAQFGVFWDYMSLPQGADRSEAEYARFKQGLQEMTGFYVHPNTYVLSVRTSIPRGDYENTRPYVQRGWCHFELRIASIVKNDGCLWDLSLDRKGTAITFDDCETTLKFTRPPLTSPEQMARELREKKFTNGGDIDVVASLYEQGFVRAFDTYRQQFGSDRISYQRLGWGTAQVPTLVAALKYAEAHCQPKDAEGREGGQWNPAKLTLSLRDNKFTTHEKTQLCFAIPERSTKFGLSFI
jgi:hypothetical protein